MVCSTRIMEMKSAHVMLWRAASNCLPTNTQSRSRHASISPICPSCRSQRETTAHCLVECSFARACWERTGIGVNATVSGSFADWLADKFGSFGGNNRNSIAMICWALWKVRNDLVWNKKGLSVAAVVMLAHNRSIVPSAVFLTTSDGIDKWVKPEGEVIKINVDAALFTEAGTYSFVCVARDAAGTVLEAITRCRAGHVAPEMAEAMGVREALSWMKEKAWHRVVIETDNLTVVQSIQSPLSMLSYFGSVISDCKTLLKNLPNASVLFIRRSANGVAHFLAKASYFVAVRTIRSENVSPEFLDVILKDC